MSSPASLSDMDFPGRLRAAWMIQRIASDVRRSARISTGTWYVAPPTRRGLTSIRGIAFLSAVSNTSMPGLRVDVSASVRAPYTMPSAVARLPLRITLLLNCWSVWLPYLRSGERRRSVGRALRGIWLSGLLLGIRVLRPVERAALLAVLHARCVERAADDVVLDRGQVGNAAAAHEHHGVLLEVVADARDVRGDFHLIGEPDSRDLPHGG